LYSLRSGLSKEVSLGIPTLPFEKKKLGVIANFGDRYAKTKHCIMLRSKNEVLCAAAGRLAAERSEADKPAKHIKPFLLRIT
jgi:hypothetical protein